MTSGVKLVMELVLRCLAILAVGTVITAGSADGLRHAADGPTRPRFGAVAFDYFVLFNPDSVVAVVERLYPGRGREFVNTWRTRQFEYSWLRSITDRYVDFARITEDSLTYTASAMHLDVSTTQRQQLIDAYRNLTPWPDASTALQRLRDANVRVITLANFSPAMLRANADNAGLTPLFDVLLSTDANHTYKPDPRAYQLGIDYLGLAKQDIVFAAFGGWDAAGAKSFGYPTVWVNRFGQPREELGISPDTTVADLRGLIEFVLGAPPPAGPM